MAKRSQKEDDEDYVDQAPPLKIKKTYKKGGAGKPDPTATTSWLTDRASRIWELNKKGHKPGFISDTLNAEAKLKKGTACKGKDVSDWIRYRKKSQQHPTNPVSSKNNNLRVDNSDSCMSTASR